MDYHHDVGVGRAGYFKTQMKKIITNRTMLTLGEAHMSALGANVTTTPNANLRFWIITMMLVLVGLATLKLR